MRVHKGMRSGKLVVRCLHSKDRNGHLRWLCDCDCGRTHTVLSTHLTRNNITHCGCETYRGVQHKQWKGCGEISGNFWDGIRRGANGSKGRVVIDFTITLEYVWDLFLSQDRKCALSGVDIWFKHTTTQGTSNTASLDRIDSSIGYVEGNVQWVHKDVNKMKNSFDQSYFIDMCKKISSYKN